MRLCKEHGAEDLACFMKFVAIHHGILPERAIITPAIAPGQPTVATICVHWIEENKTPAEQGTPSRNLWFGTAIDTRECSNKTIQEIADLVDRRVKGGLENAHESKKFGTVPIQAYGD